MENDDNVTVMLVNGFSGTLYSDLDLLDVGELDSTPWTSLNDAISIVRVVRPAPVSTSEEWWYAPRIPPNNAGLAMHIYRCFPSNLWWAGAREIIDPLLTTDTPGAQNLNCPGAIVNLCPTDLNSDGVTDSSDMGGVLGSFGPCDPGTPGDFNGDLVIDSSDLGTTLGNFGPCPTE
jgi:hypothetical protein